MQYAGLAGEEPELQVVTGHGVRVVPVQACRLRSELNQSAAARSNHRRAFFHGAIRSHRNPLAVPVNDLCAVKVVHDLDGDRLAFSHVKDVAGNLPVVGGGADFLFRRKLPLDFSDLDAVIGSGLGGGLRTNEGRFHGSGQRGRGEKGGTVEEAAPT